MRLTQIYRYPVKSLSPEALTTIALQPGQGLPCDRRFAFALAKGEAADNGNWHPKAQFLVTAKQAKLAEITCTFDHIQGTLHLTGPNDLDTTGSLVSIEGRGALEAAIQRHLGLDSRPILTEAGDIGYVDSLQGHVSILNRASLAELENKAGTRLDPRRFRPNLIIEGMEPWAENDLIGKTVQIGSVSLTVTQRTGRCQATHVNPETFASDFAVVPALKTHFDHTDLGVYAHVTVGGEIKVGDALVLPD